MKDRKLIAYIIILAVVFAATAVLPAGIQMASRLLVEKIAGEREDEMVTGDMEIMLASEDELELTDELPSEAGEEVEEKEYEEGLIRYREEFQPDHTETKNGSLAAFLEEREVAFDQAVADYLYSLYGEDLKVNRIDLIEEVREDETELVYQIEVFAEDERMDLSELFICSYNKELDFYSLYPYYG